MPWTGWTLPVRPGETYGLPGPDGAGKPDTDIGIYLWCRMRMTRRPDGYAVAGRRLFGAAGLRVPGRHRVADWSGKRGLCPPPQVVRRGYRYSAWIQLTRSSRLTVSSRAGWSVER